MPSQRELDQLVRRLRRGPGRSEVDRRQERCSVGVPSSTYSNPGDPQVMLLVPFQVVYPMEAYLIAANFDANSSSEEMGIGLYAPAQPPTGPGIGAYPSLRRLGDSVQVRAAAGGTAFIYNFQLPVPQPLDPSTVYWLAFKTNCITANLGWNVSEPVGLGISPFRAYQVTVPSEIPGVMPETCTLSALVSDGPTATIYSKAGTWSYALLP